MYVEANHSFRLNFRRGESQRSRRTPADETNDQYHQQPGASRHRPHQQYTCLPHSFPQDTPARASVPTSFLNTYSRWQARLFSRGSKGFPEPRIRFASCPNAHSVFRRTYSTHPGSQQPKLQSARTHRRNTADLRSSWDQTLGQRHSRKTFSAPPLYGGGIDSSGGKP